MIGQRIDPGELAIDARREDKRIESIAESDKRGDGTGVVEAGCKVAIGTRLKRTGVHWTVVGANAIIALRCCKLSGRFEDLWERRSTARAAVA